MKTNNSKVKVRIIGGGFSFDDAVIGRVVEADIPYGYLYKIKSSDLIDSINADIDNVDSSRVCELIEHCMQINRATEWSFYTSEVEVIEKLD